METKNECNHDENCKKPFYKSRNFLIGVMLIVVAATGGTVDYTGVLGERIIFTGGEVEEVHTQDEAIESLEEAEEKVSK